MDTSTTVSTANDTSSGSTGSAGMGSNDGVDTNTTTGAPTTTPDPDPDPDPEPDSSDSAETTRGPEDSSTSDGGSSSTGSTGEPLDCMNPSDTGLGLPVFDCQCEEGLQSIKSLTNSGIEFVNNTGAVRRIYWINYGGVRELAAEIDDGESTSWGTYVTHPWMVTDGADQCLTIFMPEPGNHTVDIP